MNTCLTGVKETLKRLNIKHDLFVLEGEFVRSGAVDAVVNELMQKIDVFGKDHELVSQQLTKALALLSVKSPSGKGRPQAHCHSHAGPTSERAGKDPGEELRNRK